MSESAERENEATSRLLTWFDANARQLPWRGREDAYQIWVSEVMLQQTRSETVERYYQPFLDRFPTLEALALAEEEEVLAAWSGLGYYRRARFLHQGAKAVLAMGGEVPTSVEQLRGLPGVGVYTAAAIASIAFGVPEPVIDGNVERVLTRLRAIEEIPRRAAGRRAVEEAAHELLSRRRPGDSNQALMELGATVCTPRRPRCGECPLAFGCAALERGEQARFPMSDPRRSTVRESWVAVVVREGGSLLLARRPETDRLLAGMWELPAVRVSAPSPEVALTGQYGGVWRLDDRCGLVRHSITHRALEVSVHRGRWEPDGIAEKGSLRWIPEIDLARLPTGSLVEKALAVATTET